MKKLLILPLCIVLFSCGSDDDDSSGPSTPTPTAEYYISSTMDGTNILYQDDDNFYVTITLDGSISPDGCTFNYGSSVSDASHDYLPSYDITFNKWIVTEAGQYG